MNGSRGAGVCVSWHLCCFRVSARDPQALARGKHQGFQVVAREGGWQCRG